MTAREVPRPTRQFGATLRLHGDVLGSGVEMWSALVTSREERASLERDLEAIAG